MPTKTKAKIENDAQADPTEAAPKAKTPGGFVAEAPERLTTRRPAPRPAPRNAEEWRAAVWPRQIKRFEALPAHAGGQVAIQVIGGRVAMTPLDQEAAIKLEGLRAQMGVTWDAKRGGDLSKLDESASRGVSGFDSLMLMLEMGGVDTLLDSQAQSAIAAYQRHLRLQKLPIPRTIWVDAEERPEGGSIEEVDIVGARHRAGA